LPGCNLIVAHHPIIFRGPEADHRQELCRADGHRGHQKRYCHLCHPYQPGQYGEEGVNGRIADKLGLEGRQVLPGQGVYFAESCIVLSRLIILRLSGRLFLLPGPGISAGIVNVVMRGRGRDVQGWGGGAAFCWPAREVRHTEKEARLEVILPAHLSRSVVKAMIGCSSL
jgi:hypothetical protein